MKRMPPQDTTNLLQQQSMKHNWNMFCDSNGDDGFNLEIFDCRYLNHVESEVQFNHVSSFST